MANGSINPKCRWWIGTLRRDDYDGKCLPNGIKYVRGQLERGEGGFEHWQVVAWTKQPQRLSFFKHAFGRTGHWEPTRSQAALEYVWKDDSRIGDPFELGEFPAKRNSKTDWELVKKNAQEGKLSEIPADIYVRHYSTLKRIALDHLRPTAVERTCQLFVGPTGTGKSKRAWEESGVDTYIKNPNTKWWDGYKGETHVIIDEFR